MKLTQRNVAVTHISSEKLGNLCFQYKQPISPKLKGMGADFVDFVTKL